jgi:hypothetical protein
MKKDNNEKCSAMKSELVQIEESIRLAKEWLEMISGSKKTSFSDKKTCKRIIKCLATANSNMKSIKQFLNSIKNSN